jgi:hypothetical protein
MWYLFYLMEQVNTSNATVFESEDTFAQYFPTSTPVSSIADEDSKLFGGQAVEESVTETGLATSAADSGVTMAADNEGGHGGEVQHMDVETDNKQASPEAEGVVCKAVEDGEEREQVSAPPVHTGEEVSGIETPAAEPVGVEVEVEVVNNAEVCMEVEAELTPMVTDVSVTSPPALDIKPKVINPDYLLYNSLWSLQVCFYCNYICYVLLY